MRSLPRFIDSPTERTTAITDVILALIAGGASINLLKWRQQAPLKAGLWGAGFGLMSLAAVFGAIAHGFNLSKQKYDLFMQPVFFSLGAMVSLFITATVHDIAGIRTARRLLPAALAVAGAFYLYTLVRPRNFLQFVIYQGAGALFVLGSYVWLAVRKWPGAGLMVGGVVVTMIASAIQATEKVAVKLIWQFDNNGVYHLVQVPGIVLLYAGVKRSLVAQPEPDREAPESYQRNSVD